MVLEKLKVFTKHLNEKQNEKCPTMCGALMVA